MPPISEGANWNSGGQLKNNFGHFHALPVFIACSTPANVVCFKVFTSRIINYLVVKVLLNLFS